MTNIIKLKQKSLKLKYFLFGGDPIPLNYVKPDNPYKLYHFMMGKGKSSIITPLVSLFYHFTPDVYII